MERAGTAVRLVGAAGAALLALLVFFASNPAAAQTSDGGAPYAGSIAGHLLVAAEHMDDPNFARTVIYMIEHDRDGAYGLVVNRPLGEMPVSELLAQMGRPPAAGDATLQVYLGGPVAPGQGIFLHSRDVMLETSVVADDGIAVTGDPEMLDVLAEKRGPRRVLFALGYAGWGPGQLEAEEARGVWFDIPADPDLVFAPDPAQTWSRAVARREIPL